MRTRGRRTHGRVIDLGLGVYEVERNRALPAQADDPVEVERLADGAPVHAPDALADLDAEARRRRACVLRTVTVALARSVDAIDAIPFKGDEKGRPHDHQE